MHTDLPLTADHEQNTETVDTWDSVNDIVNKKRILLSDRIVEHHCFVLFSGKSAKANGMADRSVVPLRNTA